MSTVITRNFRTNKRGKQRRAAAFYLVPTIGGIYDIPLVTTKKVISNRNVLTTRTLNTRKMRVNAHFTLARRDSTRFGFGSHYLQLGRKSALLALGRLSPAHLVGGSFCGRVRRTRRGKISMSRLGTLLKGNQTGGKVFRNSLCRKRLRVKRTTSRLHGLRAISRIVGRLMRSCQATLHRVRSERN